jgi:hypothetical protein
MKKSARNKDVVAPVQKSIAELIGDYLMEHGFRTFGTANEGFVFSIPVLDTHPYDLYAIVNGPFIRFYAGFRTKLKIRAKKICNCVVNELEDVLGQLKKDGYQIA